MKLSYTPAAGAYGARLILQSPVPTDVAEALSKLSVWGGPDKRGQNFVAWEFTSSHIGLALHVACHDGYVVDNHEWEEW